MNRGGICSSAGPRSSHSRSGAVPGPVGLEVDRTISVNRPLASPPPAWVRLREYFPVASASPVASGRTSISENVSVPRFSAVGYDRL